VLPEGLHQAEIREIEERFGGPAEIRRTQMESLHWLLDAVKRSGVERFVINGSFVTDSPEPNDVDCVLLIGDGFPDNEDAESEILNGYPFLEIQLVRDHAFRVLIEMIFATDRNGRPKGLVGVIYQC